MRYRSALVTGASRPLGAAVARKLAEQGVRVFVVGRHDGRLEQLARSITAHGGWAQPHPSMSSDPAERQEQVRSLDAEAGGLDLVLANLHGSDTRPQQGHDHGAEAFGPRLAIATLTAALPRMRARNRGQLVAVGALGDRRDAAGASHYAFQVVMSRLLRSLREQLRGSGVLVTETRIGPVRVSSPGTVAAANALAVDAHEAADAAVEAMRRGDPVFTYPLRAAVAARASELLSSLRRPAMG